jgi:hypothetical protein
MVRDMLFALPGLPHGTRHRQKSPQCSDRNNRYNE